MAMEKLPELAKLMEEAETIYASDADVKVKYELVHSLKISKKADECGVTFNRRDLDESYEAELAWYIDDMRELKRSLGNLLKPSEEE